MTNILIYIAATGMLLLLLLSIIQSVTKPQPLKVIFLVLVLVYFAVPAFVALILNNLLYQTRVPLEHILNVWLYCFGCVLTFLFGYRFLRLRKSPNLNRAITNKKHWEISSQAWLGLWLLGVFGFIGIGFTPMGLRALWQQGWLINAGITGQNIVSFGGYPAYIAQACVTLSPLTFLWTRHYWQKLLTAGLIGMGLVYGLVGGGRVVFAPFILAVLLRLFIDNRNPGSRVDRMYISIISSSFWYRLRLTSIIAFGLIFISLLFNFVYFLRNYRDSASLFDSLISTRTYNIYLNNYLQDPNNTPIGDMVWIYAFRVTYDAPHLIPIQPIRIFSDIIAYLVPGFIYDFGRSITIENELAYLYNPGTFAGATIHPSFIGISYLLLGWYGFLSFTFLGLIANFLDGKLQPSVDPYHDLLWIGLVFIFGYWMVFTLRGAITFASFRSLYTFYMWIFMWIGLRLLHWIVPISSPSAKTDLPTLRMR